MKNIYKELICVNERKEESKIIKEMNEIPIIFIIFDKDFYDSGTIFKFASETHYNIYSILNFPKHIKFKFYLKNTEGTPILIEGNEKYLKYMKCLKIQKMNYYIFLLW